MSDDPFAYLADDPFAEETKQKVVERLARAHREDGRVDPVSKLVAANEYDFGHPARESYERQAIVAAAMRLSFHFKELTDALRDLSDRRNGGPS